MIKGYKISNANEETNGIWLVDTETGDARHLTSTEHNKVWKNFFDFTNCKAIVVEEIPMEFEEPKQITGQHLNVNVLNQETLLKAIEQPELYPNLVVRISGYATRFNALTEEQKQDIVTRTFHKQM